MRIDRRRRDVTVRPDETPEQSRERARSQAVTECCIFGIDDGFRLSTLEGGVWVDRDARFHDDAVRDMEEWIEERIQKILGLEVAR